MKKALLIDFTGTISNVKKNSDLNRFIANIAENRKDVTSDYAREWWVSRMNQFEEEAKGENFISKDEIFVNLIQKARERFAFTEDINRLLAMYNESRIYSSLHNDVTELFQYCPIPIYVVSNHSKLITSVYMKRNDLHPCGIFTAEDARAYMPDPALLKLVIEKIDLAKEDCLFVSRKNNFVETALAERIPSVLVDRDSDFRKASYPRVRSLEEIILMIERENA